MVLSVGIRRACFSSHHLELELTYDFSITLETIFCWQIHQRPKLRSFAPTARVNISMKEDILSSRTGFIFVFIVAKNSGLQNQQLALEKELTELFREKLLYIYKENFIIFQ
jgi:hypothetical protein